MKKDNYHITPIQTLYKNRLYRSRLEAKWACFFDLFNWQYEYEPFDLNGWSPDFLLKLPCGELTNIYNVLVEVKPDSMININLYERLYKANEGTDYSLLILKEFPIDKEGSYSFGFSGKMPLTKTESFFFEVNGKKYKEFSTSLICQRESGEYSIMPYDNPESDDKHWRILGDNEIQEAWDIASNNVMFMK